MSQLEGRRAFVGKAAVLLGSIIPLSGYSFFREHSTTTGTKKLIPKLNIDLSDLPNFCTHEHWGSIQSIGEMPTLGFRCDTTAGALPLRNTSVWDLFLDPYEHGWLKAGKKDPHTAAKEAGFTDFLQWWQQSPTESLKVFQQLIQSSLLTGGFQCTRKGIQLLYERDLEKFDSDDWSFVDARVAEHYHNPFKWYRQAMKQANFSELIRPVQPEFYIWKQSEETKHEEALMTKTVMRIDPLTDFWKEKSARRDELSKITGIEPVDARSWKLFIEKLFDIAESGGAVGIKQMQAYRRSLHFQQHSDKDVRFRGKLSDSEITKFQDWVVHECCRQCHARKWPHQVHVGTHNLSASTPLPLQHLAQKYPDMKLVMIHCWPFLQEAAFLAKLVPNIYVDTCWLPVLNPEFLREAFHYWLGYVPAHKIMLGHDSTHVEMAAGSSIFTREILSESLAKYQRKLDLTARSVKSIAADMLHNNAVRLYGMGKEYTVS